MQGEPHAVLITLVRCTVSQLVRVESNKTASAPLCSWSLTRCVVATGCNARKTASRQVISNISFSRTRRRTFTRDAIRCAMMGNEDEGRTRVSDESARGLLSVFPFVFHSPPIPSHDDRCPTTTTTVRAFMMDSSLSLLIVMYVLQQTATTQQQQYVAVSVGKMKGRNPSDPCVNAGVEVCAN